MCSATDVIQIYYIKMSIKIHIITPFFIYISLQKTYLMIYKYFAIYKIIDTIEKIIIKMLEWLSDFHGCFLLYWFVCPFNLTFKSCCSKLDGILSTWQSEKSGSIFFISSFWTMLRYSNPRDFSINFTQSSNLGQSLTSHLK